MPGVIASQLVAKVATEGSEEANAKLRSVGATSDSVGAKMGSVLKEAALVGAGAFLALGVSATKLAGDYNAGLTTLVTGAGEYQKNLGMVHDKVLDVSVATGTMTNQLIAGEYEINSAGQKGSQALDTLKMAAEGAKVGAADLGVTANATTTIMTDFASQHITAAQAVNTLIATVSDGKTHMDELAGSFATVLPVAAAFSLHLQDVTGALATMTGEGTPAADAATYLRQTIASLESPGAKAVAVLKEIGLTSAQISDSMKVSIPQTLQLIEDHLARKFPVGSAAYTNALKDIAGGTKTFQGMLELTGTHLDTFESDVADITSKVKLGGDSIVGWSLVQHDFNQQLDETHAALDATLIKLGEELMPLVSRFLTEDVMPAISHFQEWENQTHGLENAFSDVISVLGTVITDTEAVVSWFGKGGVQGMLLKDVLLGIGVAIATIKLADFASSLIHLATDTIPQALVKFGLLKTAVAETAVAEAGTNGVASATETVATGFTKLLGPIGLATTAVYAAKSAWDAYIQSLPQNVQQLPGFKSGEIVGSDPFAITRGVADFNAQQQASAQQQSLQALKAQQDSINQAWRDMNSLYDEFSGKRLLGLMNDPLGGIVAFDTKVMDTKTHLDDLSNAVFLDGSLKPTIIGTLTTQAEALRLKIIEDKSQLDDLKNAASIGIPNVNAAAYQRIAGRDNTTLPGHASGISNNPVGHWATVGERGPEPMWIPQGASVFPHGSTPNTGGGSGQPTPVYLQIDGQTIARLLLPYNAPLLRAGLGMIGV